MSPFSVYSFYDIILMNFPWFCVIITHEKIHEAWSIKELDFYVILWRGKFKSVLYRFAIVLVYYGITLNLGKFGADLYVSFSLSVAAEALGYAAVLLMDMIGHKRLLMTALAATGASCIVSVFPVMFADKCNAFYLISTIWYYPNKLLQVLAFQKKLISHEHIKPF